MALRSTPSLPSLSPKITFILQRGGRIPRSDAATWGHDRFQGAAPQVQVIPGQLTEVMVSNLAKSITQNDIKVCKLRQIPYARKCNLAA